MKIKTAQQSLETYLAIHNLDIEIDMTQVGNLEMLCAGTLSALQKGAPLSKAVTVTPTKSIIIN